MEAAYDLKSLGEKLQSKGLPIAEIALEQVGALVYLSLKEWAKESALLSENKLDDVIAPFYDQLDQVVLPLIEKLDLNGDKK
jgi:hypothetical protein